METQTQSTTKWTIDAAHSEVQFKVKHLVISTVTGRFNTFSGSVETIGDDLEGGSATFEADVNSIDTNAPDRDAHLKSAEFFDAENHPKLTFKSTKITKVEDDLYSVEGLITIRGTEKPITLSAEFGGSMVDPYGNHKAGYEITGSINRKEFGLSWSAVTEAGGAVVADKVKLHLNIQIQK